MKIVIEGVEYNVTPTQSQLEEVLEIVKNNSDGKRVPCEICGRKFKNNRGVGLHKAHAHKEEDVE